MTMTLIYEKIISKTWDEEGELPAYPSRGAFEVSYLDTTYFVVDGKLHRTDGPAEIWSNGTEFYYQNDRLHRVDGPAIIWAANGDHSYYLFGKQYQKEDWEPLVIQLNLKEQIL